MLDDRNGNIFLSFLNNIQHINGQMAAERLWEAAWWLA